jgi:Kdo2-lipid IVA lauroyltransferase/acyltransferase
MQTPPPFSAFTEIKYWPTWIGISLLYILAWMPFRVRIKAGEFLGILIYWLGKERRYITSINIGICFPELDASEQNKLVRKIFQEYSIGVIETATGWVRKPGSFKDQTTLIGLDKLEAAKAKGKGVLLISAHYPTLDFSANLLFLFHPFGATYRPHRNALFDAFMLRGRLSNCNGVFDRNDIRGAFRHLKQGNTLWYAPDQDYGPEHAVFVPFFGRQAATITAASRFAKFNDSPVFLFRQHRNDKTRQYELEFIPFPDDFPGDNEEINAALINRMIEQTIREYPAQYLWMHKRFKTQPGGKPDSPYINISTPLHRLTGIQHDQIMAQATQIAKLDKVLEFRLDSGLWLRQYPGQVSKRFYSRHPAKLFDRNAKILRMHGIKTITVDNFFRIPVKKISAATYFVPKGEMLSKLPVKQIPLQSLAGFIAMLHEKGFDFSNPSADMFTLDTEDASFAILDPTGFILRKSPTNLRDRRKSVTKLIQNLGLESQDSDFFYSNYAQAAGLGLTEITSG